jgi:predicted esterase
VPLLHRHARTALLISESFPQVPVKPLGVVTTAPAHQSLEFASARGNVVADLFLPTQHLGAPARRSRPALILAMGVKTAPKDRPLILDLAQTFARLDMVVLWPRLEVLDEGVSLPEEPETFIGAVQYLQTVDVADPSRISLFGFSTGASTGLVAASDPRIADAVRSVIFFGGYYDIRDYLVSLATATTTYLDGETGVWQPSDEAVGQIREILANKQAHGILEAFEATSRDEAAALLDAAPEEEWAELTRFSPSLNNADFHGRLFILHDTGDPLVPFGESARLYQALSPRVETTYIVTSLFEHVQPKKELTPETLDSLLRLYGFIDQALDSL